MKATHVEIKKSCRETHGKLGAFLEAIKYLQKQYMFYLQAKQNKDKTIRIEIHIDE